MLARKFATEIVLKFLNFGLNLFALYLAARAFLPEIFGEVALIVGLCSIGLMFFDPGFNTAAHTKIAQNKFSPEANIATLLYYKLVLTIVYALVLALVYFSNQSNIQTVGVEIFLLVAVALYIDAISSSLQQYFVGQQNYYHFMFSNFFTQLGGSIFLIMVSLYWPTKFNYAAVIMVKSIILIAIMLFYYRKVKIDWKIRKDLLKEYFDYAKPFFILMPLYYFAGNIERIVLPHLILPASMAIFIFGLKFYDILAIFRKTFSLYAYTYIANVTEKFKGNELISRLENLTAITHALAAVLIIGLINRSAYLMVFLFSDRYLPSAIVAQLMGVLFYIEFVFVLNSHFIFVKSEQKKLVKWTILSTVVMLVSMSLLIPENLFGMNVLGLEYIGMPLAKIITLIIPGIIISLFLTKQFFNTSFLKVHFKFFLFAIIYFVLDYYLLSIAKENPIWLATSWLIGISAYALSVLFLYFDTSIKEEVYNIFRQKKLKIDEKIV